MDGDLSNIEHFASRAVLDYYESIGITPDPAQDAGPEDADPEKAPAQTNKEKKHRPRSKGKDGGQEPLKQAEKKRTRISVTAFQRPVIVAFAQVLDPEAYIDGSAVVVAEGCADAVKDFLAKL